MARLGDPTECILNEDFSLLKILSEALRCQHGIHSSLQLLVNENHELCHVLQIASGKYKTISKNNFEAKQHPAT